MSAVAVRPDLRVDHLELGRTPNDQPFLLGSDSVTDTFVIFGKKGSGKSNAAVVFAEELYRVHIPFVALDPVGHWWGLKSRPDGSPGLSVFVFGGPHADLPLEPTAGALMADVLLDSRISMVLCTLEFTGGERAKFVTAFAQRLLKRALAERTVAHLFLEEADQFAPQNPFAGEREMLGAVERLVRQIRQGGIGVTLITQRSAAINKGVSNQADCLIAFRTLGPRDRDAIDEWVKFHDGGEQRQTVLESLASLDNGEGWLWSPERLDFLGRVRWRRRATFDAAATPKVGEARIQPTLAVVDLEQLRAQMESTIERAKADDPKELRKRIALLEAQARAVELKIVEVPALTPEERADVYRLADAVLEAAGIHARINERLEKLAGRLVAATAPAPVPSPPPVPPRPGRSAPPEPPAPIVASPPSTMPTEIPRALQRILDAIAWWYVLGIRDPDRRMVAFVAGVSSKSSGYENNISRLRSLKLLDYPASGRLALTEDGENAAAMSDVPANRDGYHAMVMQALPPALQRILRVLIEDFPRELSRDALATRAGVSAASSGYENNVSRLKSLGLIDYPDRGMVRASDMLFVLP